MTVLRRLVVRGPAEPDDLPSMGAATISEDDARQHALARIQPGLRELFRTRRPVIVAPTPGAGLLEAVARSGITDRALAIVGGRGGERFAAVAEACGKEVIRAHVPEGAALEARHLSIFLDGPAVDAVTLVHAEPSSGALAPLEELAAIVRSRTGVMLLVDASHSLGAEPLETDGWGIDAVVAGGDGPVGLPAGLAVAAVSERLVARARGATARGWALDLVRLDEASGSSVPSEPPPDVLVEALARRLERIAGMGGTPAAWEHHAAVRAAVDRWLEGNPGWSCPAREGRRCAALTVLERSRDAGSERTEIRLAGFPAAPDVIATLDTLARTSEPAPAV